MVVNFKSFKTLERPSQNKNGSFERIHTHTKKKENTSMLVRQVNTVVVPGIQTTVCFFFKFGHMVNILLLASDLHVLGTLKKTLSPKNYCRHLPKKPPKTVITHQTSIIYVLPSKRLDFLLKKKKTKERYLSLGTVLHLSVVSKNTKRSFTRFCQRRQKSACKNTFNLFYIKLPQRCP